MPRCARVAPGGVVYHVLNRAVARATLFNKDGDYAAFERVLGLALERCSLRLLAFCLMPTHWHGRVRLLGARGRARGAPPIGSARDAVWIRGVANGDRTASPRGVNVAPPWPPPETPTGEMSCVPFSLLKHAGIAGSQNPDARVACGIGTQTRCCDSSRKDEDGTMIRRGTLVSSD